VAALLLAVAGGAAMAQGARLDVLDQRGDLLGWEAVGRLDLPGGFCTGALIARDVVLTAAHCVHDRTTGAPLPAAGMVFRAGYHRGTQIVAQRVRHWVAPSGYVQQPGQRLGAEAIAHDVALLKLEAPVSVAEADPFRIHDTPPEGTAVSLLSYGRGREEVLSRQPACAMTGRYAGGILEFDCSVTWGSSGAPVFVREAGRLRILSVISVASDPGQGTGHAMGPSLPALVADLSARLRGTEAQTPVSAGARRVSVGDGRGGMAARFVRVPQP